MRLFAVSHTYAHRSEHVWPPSPPSSSSLRIFPVDTNRLCCRWRLTIAKPLLECVVAMTTVAGEINLKRRKYFRCFFPHFFFVFISVCIKHVSHQSHQINLRIAPFMPKFPKYFTYSAERCGMRSTSFMSLKFWSMRALLLYAVVSLRSCRQHTAVFSISN